MISVADHAGIAVVRLEHGKVNVLDLELLHALIQAFKALTDADAVVLTGAGRAFSAGVDLKRILDGGREYTAAFLPALTGAFRAVFDHPRPVVAAVNGHAIAGGCILVAASDLRLMSAGTIGVTELLVGVPFPPSALETLRFAVGPATARLVLTGRTLSPAEALEVGLIDQLVAPDLLLNSAIEAAGALASIPRATFEFTKAQLRQDASRRMEADGEAYAERILDGWANEQTRAAIAGYLRQLAARRG